MLETLWIEIKRHNKALVILKKPWYYFVSMNIGFIWIFMKNANPYSRAIIRLSYLKYKEGFSYNERVEVMGESYAKQRFADEIRYYKKQLNWKDKARALFIPFTIISEDV